MGYKVKQFQSSESPNDYIISLLNSSYVDLPIESARCKTLTLHNYSSETHEECINLKNNFDKDSVYYFHGYVLKKSAGLGGQDEFNVYLVRGTDINFEDLKNFQKIKSFEVSRRSGNSDDNWEEIEFLFNPISDEFNTLAFVRTRDPSTNATTDAFIFQELSEVKDIVSNNNFYDSVDKQCSIIKAGIQTKPNTLVCVNKEEFKIGKSGIHEFKNGYIKIDSFGIVVKGIVNNKEVLNTLKGEVLGHNVGETSGYGWSQFLGEDYLTREVPKLYLDYVYEYEDSN